MCFFLCVFENICPSMCVCVFMSACYLSMCVCICIYFLYVFILLSIYCHGSQCVYLSMSLYNCECLCVSKVIRE